MLQKPQHNCSKCLIVHSTDIITAVVMYSLSLFIREMNMLCIFVSISKYSK